MSRKSASSTAGAGTGSGAATGAGGRTSPSRPRAGAGRGVASRLAETFDLPKDVVLNLPRITLVGHLQATVENFQGLIEYNPGRIRVATPHGQIVVTGRELAISGSGGREMIVVGFIERVEFSS